MGKDVAAQWTTSEEELLLDELLDHASQGADGSTFKMPVFNAVALVVDAKRTKGGVKDGKACQNKYSAVMYS
jgi:hypothetical protein